MSENQEYLVSHNMITLERRLVKNRWTDSTLSMRYLWCGDQTWEENSNNGLTYMNELKATFKHFPAMRRHWTFPAARRHSHVEIHRTDQTRRSCRFIAASSVLVLVLTLITESIFKTRSTRAERKPPPRRPFSIHSTSTVHVVLNCISASESLFNCSTVTWPLRPLTSAETVNHSHVSRADDPLAAVTLTYLFI